MFARIVVGVDGSHTSELAARAAFTLTMGSEAEVHLVSVIEELPRYVSAREEATREAAEARRYFDDVHEQLMRDARKDGVNASAQVLVGHEVQQLLQYVLDVQGDLLVIGHAGHSALWGTALGSTASQLVRRSPCSVMVVRAQTLATHLARVAVALDGSPLGWEAFAVGAELAQHTRHPLHIISVIEGSLGSGGASSSLTGEPSGSAHAWQSLLISTQARATARAATMDVGVEVSTRTGSASDALVAAVRELDMDVLVVGATGHERPWSETTGGTATKVAEEATCMVLVVRPLARGSCVADLMEPAPHVISANSSLTEALSLLLDEGIRLVPVVSREKTLLGIVTLGHLLQVADPKLAEHLTRFRAPSDARGYLERLAEGRIARDLMISRPYVLQPDVPVYVAGRYLTMHRVTRLPVVDGARHLLGVLSEDAVTAALVAPHAYQDEIAPASADPNAAIVADAHPDPLALEAAHGAPLTAEMLADRSVLTVLVSASLDEVIATVQRARGGVVMVLADDGRVLRGVVDARALLRHVFPESMPRWGGPLIRLLTRSQTRLLGDVRGQSPAPMSAASVMRPAEPRIAAGTPIAEALARLIAAGQSDMGVVVASDGHPIGILWRRIALRALVKG